MQYDNCFWKAINILITKPHVVNKRLWGYNKLLEFKCEPLQENWENELPNIKLKNDAISIDRALNVLKDALAVELVDTKNAAITITLVELLPKAYNEKHAYQLVCINTSKNVVTFYNVTPEEYKQNLCPNIPYSFYLLYDKILLKKHTVLHTKSQLWLENIVLPQVIKWAHEENNGHKQLCTESLSLVAKDKYYEKYNNLKLKYGTEMVKIWPESTDPLKFVYEDVAIATYLLIIWENENLNKPIKFVDIGCGNGLLVYILTMEGHCGLGLDVRKRKIWDVYPKSIALKECTVDPSNETFLNYDWVIGNHSDELTPWIPVIAARSSYKCNFFLLPCCAFNFDGSKYRRKNTSTSQYCDYLLYIRELCQNLGFKTEMDRLKIPSTKRICFVSSERSYLKEQHGLKLDLIKTFINEELGTTLTNEIKIKFRPTTERVRNCTQLDKNVTEQIVIQITNYLLKDIDLHQWSIGKTEKLSVLIKLLSIEKLKVLKSECGGLQTLLRNNHHIFQVQNGCVQLRYPKTTEEVKKKSDKNKCSVLKMNVKKCWFYNHHPLGCPLQSNVCSYLHEKT